MQRRQFLSLPIATLTAAQPVMPNIVLIYCDDLGYGDLGCYGSSIPTPNLDRMASEGVRFTNFYSANPVCSPSRAALLTGRYPTRVSVPRVFFPADQNGLARDEQTLADVLKASGYRTMCVGKWHLGHTPAYLPTSRGFDEYFGIPYSNDMSPRLMLKGTEAVEQQAALETITPRYTEQAVGFIERNKARPFFLYMPHTYPHIPLAASDKFRGKSNQGLYGDVLQELDWSVGEVLGALKKNGLEKNTLVLFSSDNGPWFQGSAGKLRGRKGQTYEGGVRVPFIARWPGKIPARRVLDAIGSTLDMMPTLARLAGAKLPTKALDGVDIWPLLSGQKKDHTREALLYFDNWDLQCVRLGKWKLHVGRYNSFIYGPVPATGRVNLRLRPAELYNLATDPDESFDVAAKNPEIVRDLEARIAKALPSFPDEVQKAWRETEGRQTTPGEPGRLPRVKP